MQEKNQTKLLDALVEAFKEESVAYRDIETPSDTEGKRRLLRSLMNVRAPRALDPETLRAQDAYLSAARSERYASSVQRRSPPSHRRSEAAIRTQT